MFYCCTNLIEAPELPAAELKEGCYYNMFRDCLNLNCIKVHFKDWDLPFETLTTSHWVYNVADSGTFVCPKDLPIEFHDKSKIPEGWTIKYIEEITGVDLINEKLEEILNERKQYFENIKLDIMDTFKIWFIVFWSDFFSDNN